MVIVVMLQLKNHKKPKIKEGERGVGIDSVDEERKEKEIVDYVNREETRKCNENKR